MPLKGIWQCLKTVLVVTTEGQGLQLWVEARETAGTYRKALTTKNYPASNVSSAETENPCCKLIDI